MRVEVRAGSRTQRRWHETLVQRLGESGDTEVRVQLTEDEATVGRRRLQRLLRLERLLHGLDEGLLASGRLLSTTTNASDDEPEVVLDLTSTPLDGCWTVLYDGRPGEEAAVDALRCGQLPLVSVIDGSGSVRAMGRPGSDLPGLFATTLADIGAGTATLVAGAIADRPFAPPAEAPVVTRSPRGFTAIAARRVIGAAIRRLYRALYRAPHWRVGWRRLDGPDLLSLGYWPKQWQDVPDDGHRFYADPFPFEYGGRTYLFVEDFVHRDDKAVISVAVWGPDGLEATPTPVLSHDVHLSYPFVLEHDGEIWMIPETSEAATVELYRAVDFPGKWERHAVLIEGLRVSDATPFLIEGRWWLSATAGYGGSLSDSLCFWTAPDLTGPWTEHAHNPVLVDIASARPAGRIQQHDGQLLRPVQDGRNGYGAALAVAEVTRLDDEGFDQRVVQRYGPGAGWAGTRLHTLNSAGGIETVDGSRLVPRFARRVTGSGDTALNKTSSSAGA